MKKRFIGVLTLSLLISASTFGMALNTGEWKTDSETGLRWRRDQFGNIHPDLKSVDKERLGASLKLFVARRAESEQGNAFLIKAKHQDDGEFYSAIREAGFACHFADDEGIEWTVKNGSPMPEAATAAAGARVIVRRGDQVLAVEDKHRKGKIMFPGGSVDSREFPSVAASRELLEEVGLKADPQSLQLVGLLARIRANRYGSTDYCHYYVANEVIGEVEIQESEIERAEWVSLRAMAAGEKVEGLSVSLINQALARHLLGEDEARGEGAHLVLPDLRQAGKPVEEQDPKDVMTLDLFRLERAGVSHKL